MWIAYRTRARWARTDAATRWPTVPQRPTVPPGGPSADTRNPRGPPSFHVYDTACSPGSPRPSTP
eukprot:7840835-Pyramimonas_sp.AAC.1